MAIAVLVWHRHWRGIFCVNLLGIVVFLIFVLMPAYFLVDQVRQLPLRELSAIAAQVEQPGEPLIMIGFKKPSIVFYMQRRVNYISSPEHAMAQIEKIVLTQPQPPSVLILSQPKKLPHWDSSRLNTRI